MLLVHDEERFRHRRNNIESSGGLDKFTPV
jgi:hypothetical protein